MRWAAIRKGATAKNEALEEVPSVLPIHPDVAARMPQAMPEAINEYSIVERACLRAQPAASAVLLRKRV